jgi:hypothetical protein
MSASAASTSSTSSFDNVEEEEDQPDQILFRQFSHALLIHDGDGEDNTSTEDNHDDGARQDNMYCHHHQNLLLTFLEGESVSPSKLRLYTESVKRIAQRLRSSSSSEKEEEIMTLRELVDRADDRFAMAILASSADSDNDNDDEDDSKKKGQEAAKRREEEALAEFYLELGCLLGNISSCASSSDEENNKNVLYHTLTTGALPLSDILRCCHQAARNSVRRRLHLHWEVD